MKFIFEVHIRPGHTAEEYADIWVRTSKIIQQAPGARGTYLHRKIGDPNVLVAIATWDSKAHRDAKDDKRGEAIRAILQEAAGKVDIRVIGEFEEPEWIVLPQQL
jgi:heme-degrading monooxygenase HmoA